MWAVYGIGFRFLEYHHKILQCSIHELTKFTMNYKGEFLFDFSSVGNVIRFVGRVFMS